MTRLPFLMILSANTLFALNVRRILPITLEEPLTVMLPIAGGKMSGKERLILFTLFLVVMVLLPIAVKATTGDDVVKVRHSKADVSGPRPNITLKTYFTISRH